MEIYAENTVPQLGPEELRVIAQKYAQRDAAECLAHEEPCTGPTAMVQALEELRDLMRDNYSEHLMEEATEVPPVFKDELLKKMAQYHTCDDATTYVRNRWPCANASDLEAALREVRSLEEARYNQMAVARGLPGVPSQDPVPSTSKTDASATSSEIPALLASSDNWAHQALLDMDEVNSLIAWCAGHAPEPKYTPAAKAFWAVCHRLAQERANLLAQVPAVTAEPNGWQPYATAPRDGTRVDLWATYRNGTRILDVRFIAARDVDERYAPGGEWEHLGQDGWRHSTKDDSVLVDKDVTHWRLAEADRPPGM